MDDIQPGAIFYAKEQGKEAIPVRLSTLFRVAGHEEIYGLAFKITGNSAKGLKLDPYGASRKLGAPLSDLLKASKALDTLFVAVEFDKGLSPKIPLKSLKVSRDVMRNIFGRHEMKVKRLKADPHDTGGHKSYSGFLTGGINNSTVAVDGETVVIERVGKVRGKGGRPFAQSGDGGDAVVSNSGALLGFVVAGAGDTTLVVPAEDVASGAQVEFLTPSIEVTTAPTTHFATSA